MFFQLFMLIRPGIITGLSPNVAVSIVRLSKWPMNTQCDFRGASKA